MWCHIAKSVKGTAHAADNSPCQDSLRVITKETGGESVLIACVADGAGSAKYADEGSTLACDSVMENIVAFITSGGLLKTVKMDHVRKWCDDARRQIETRANQQDQKMRDFATTLCVAVCSQFQSVFFQIGDGAIIAQNPGGLGVVFWPQSGEYANSTNFLTDNHYEQHLDFHVSQTRFTDIALLTDGLERLALSFATRTAHAPFFQPLFAALQVTSDPASLTEDLRKFLESDPVKDRSDDDKTLVLTSWIDRETNHSA